MNILFHIFSNVYKYKQTHTHTHTHTHASTQKFQFWFVGNIHIMTSEYLVCGF